MTSFRGPWIWSLCMFMYVIYIYYTTSSASGRDEPNLTLWLATRVGKMELFFCVFMDLDFVSVHKHAKKELGQYPAILTSCLVNNPYICTYYMACVCRRYNMHSDWLKEGIILP